MDFRTGKNRALTPEGTGGPKPPFGRGVIREVFPPPLFFPTPPWRPLTAYFPKQERMYLNLCDFWASPGEWGSEIGCDDVRICVLKTRSFKRASDRSLSKVYIYIYIYLFLSLSLSQALLLLFLSSFSLGLS